MAAFKFLSLAKLCNYCLEHTHLALSPYYCTNGVIMPDALAATIRIASVAEGKLAPEGLEAGRGQARDGKK